MDGVGAGGPGGRDDGVDVEQVEASRAVGARDDRPDAEPVAGPGDPAGDLAAVGDEERPDRRSGARPPRRRQSRAVERVNRVSRDTPAAADASRGQTTARDPALDRPRRRPEALSRLAWA